MMRTTILVGALALMAGGLVACGGDDGGEDLSLEDYFGRLEDSANEFQAEIEELGGEFDERAAEAGEDIDELIDLAREFFGDAAGAFEDFVDQIDGLNPPEEAADAHEDAVDAGRDSVDALEQVASDFEDAETEDDFLEVIESSGDPTANFTASCLDLQAIAVENDIDADLQCEGSIAG